MVACRWALEDPVVPHPSSAVPVCAWAVREAPSPIAAGFSRASMAVDRGSPPAGRGGCSRSALRARAGATACPRTRRRRARRPTRSAPHSFAPSRRWPQHHVGVQSVQQHARRRRRRPVLATGPRHRARSLGGRPGTRKRRGIICSIRMRGLHQLLLFLGQRTQRRDPTAETGHAGSTASGGEGDAQVHFLTTHVAYCTLTSKASSQSMADEAMHRYEEQYDALKAKLQAVDSSARAASRPAGL